MFIGEHHVYEGYIKSGVEWVHKRNHPQPVTRRRRKCVMVDVIKQRTVLLDGFMDRKGSAWGDLVRDGPLILARMGHHVTTTHISAGDKYRWLTSGCCTGIVNEVI
jgi:hypothetical protein